MKPRLFLFSAVAILTAAVTIHAGAEAPPQATYITVKMHCAGCAKKMAARLQALPQVAEVKFKVESNLLMVVPKPQQLPSPRAQWEAVEKAGYQPIALKGPFGVFKEKPKT